MSVSAGEVVVSRRDVTAVAFAAEVGEWQIVRGSSVPRVRDRRTPTIVAGQEGAGVSREAIHRSHGGTLSDCREGHARRRQQASRGGCYDRREAYLQSGTR